MASRRHPRPEGTEYDEGRQARSVPTDGARDWCGVGVAADDRAETTASAGSLGADLRVEDLVAACAAGGRVDRRAAKLCALPAGPLRRNPKVVVLGFDGPCERYGLDNADRFVEVDAERLLADINLRRQVEVAIRAVDPKLDGSRGRGVGRQRGHGR
jgi:hypothetical protein